MKTDRLILCSEKRLRQLLEVEKRLEIARSALNTIGYEPGADSKYFMRSLARQTLEKIQALERVAT